MLILSINVDKYAQLFETFRKTIPVSLHQGPVFFGVLMIFSCLRLPE